MADQFARGIFARFGNGEDPFRAPNGMEDNLRLIDDHLALYTFAPVAPGTPLPDDAPDGSGQIYTDGSYAVLNGGVWKTYAPRKGVCARAESGFGSWINTGSGWRVDNVPAGSVEVEDGAGGSLFTRLSGFITWAIGYFTGSVADYTALRASTRSSNCIVVRDRLAGGIFVYDSADATSADNGGTIIVRADGRRYKRLYDGAVFARWFSPNLADALESASAAARFVKVDAGGELDRVCTIAHKTTIEWMDVLIEAAEGIATTHLLTLAGDFDSEGLVRFDGVELPAPSSSWAGLTDTPQGSCIYAAGPSNSSRAGRVRIDPGVEFMGFPGGPIFAKWLALFDADGIRVTACQSATLQYKASGSYANVPTTNTLGLERITNAAVEVYQCDVVRVRNSFVPAVSKGVSLAGTVVQVQDNVYSLGTPRHCMEHITSSANVIATGSSYNGYADKGDSTKVVQCDSVVVGGGALRNSAYGRYMQDCLSCTVLPDEMDAVSHPYYVSQTELSTGDITVDGQVGVVVGDGTGNFLALQANQTAIAAGHKVSIKLSGGSANGFAWGFVHNTSAYGVVLDISLVGGFHLMNATSGGLDLRARTIDIDAKFTNVYRPLSIGSTKKTEGGSAVTPSKNANVKAVFEDCTDALCRVGAQAVYDCQFETINLDLSGNDGTRILSFGLATDDTCKLLRAKVNGFNQSLVGSAVYIDAGGKAFKAALDLVLIDSASGPNNVTFVNAASLTGDLRNRICGIVGSHALTLA